MRTAPHARDLDDASAASEPHVAEEGPRDPDRCDQQGVQLMPDLIVTQFLGCAHRAVAGVVHHDVDALASLQDSV